MPFKRDIWTDLSCRKKSPINPRSTTAFCRASSSLSSPAMLAAVIMLSATLVSPMANAMTVEMCKKYGDHCISGCEQRSIGKDVCIKHCVKAQSECYINSKPTSGQNAPPTTDPINPKGTGDRTSPTGGTKADPKVPPKVNDARPPMGGGVFHPKTSGADTSGPILHSTGTGQPAPQPGGTSGPILLKSNGGGGPSVRSNGHR